MKDYFRILALDSRILLQDEKEYIKTIFFFSKQRNHLQERNVCTYYVNKRYYQEKKLLKAPLSIFTVKISRFFIHKHFIQTYCRK